MSACPAPSPGHLRARQLIGMIALTFTEFEKDVEACLQSMTGSESFATRRMRKKLSFSGKLDTVYGTLAEQHAHDPSCLVALRRWRRRLERFRMHRNGLVHGTWDEATQTIRHQAAAEELERGRTRFNLHELSSELDALRQFRAATLHDWFKPTE
jgi:hypothetical protein